MCMEEKTTLFKRDIKALLNIIGQHYKDVLQIADKVMYENKKYLKEKYNMKGR